MNITKSVLVAAALGGIIIVSAGDLAPPAGPVTPTMKTLTEVEPRTALQSLFGSVSAKHIVNVSGSYYLTRNLEGESGKSGILVTANDVTIDLNGFTLAGVAGSTHGVDVNSNRRNVTVRNGVVTGWGGDGVRLTFASNSAIEDVRAYENGGNGIRLGNGGRLQGCVSEGNQGVGIISNGGCTLTDCVARDNVGDGFSSGGQNNITRCVANSNTGNGMSVGTGSIVSDCVASGNDKGLRFVSNTVVRDTICDQNTTAGLHAVGNDNRIEGNHLTRGGIGLDIDGGNNFVSDNTVRGNTDNYDIFGTTNQLNILLGQIPETINWPASVKLAGTLRGVSGSHGILVSADDVTIDLNGHALIGANGSLSGIAGATGFKNLHVYNGIVRDWGAHGVRAQLSANNRIERVTATGNGQSGIGAGLGSVITDCTAADNGLVGISVTTMATVSRCTAQNNGAGGISLFRSTATDCVATGNTGVGFFANGGSVISRCTSSDNTEHGFDARTAIQLGECMARNNGIHGFTLGDGSSISGSNAWLNAGSGFDFTSTTMASRIENCTASDNAFYGISALSNVTILNNSCSRNGRDVQGAGIYIRLAGSGNKIEGNDLRENYWGVDIDGTRNLVIKNTMRNNIQFSASVDSDENTTAFWTHWGDGGIIDSIPTGSFTNFILTN